jgi:UDP-glucose 4-epimerase
LKTALGQRDEMSIFGTDYPTPDGTCIRDYIHVLDLAQAHLLALDALSERGQLVYNLGNGSGFTVREVIEVAFRITKRPIRVVEGQRRPGDPAILVASSHKIRTELGWKPQYPNLEDIVCSAWEWHQAHPHGYQN